MTGAVAPDGSSRVPMPVWCAAALVAALAAAIVLSPTPGPASGPPLARVVPGEPTPAGLTRVAAGPLQEHQVAVLAGQGYERAISEHHVTSWRNPGETTSVHVVVLRMVTASAATTSHVHLHLVVTGDRPREDGRRGDLYSLGSSDTGQPRYSVSRAMPGAVILAAIGQADDPAAAEALARERLMLAADTIDAASFTAPFVSSVPRYLVGSLIAAAIVVATYVTARTLLGLRYRRVGRTAAPAVAGTTVEVDREAAAVRRAGRDLLTIQLTALVLGVLGFAWIVLWGNEGAAVVGGPVVPLVASGAASLAATRWRLRSDPGRHHIRGWSGRRTTKSVVIATAGALFLLAGLMLLSMFSVTLAASVDLLPYLTTFRAAVTSFVRGTTTVMFGGAALVVVSLAAALFRWSRREQTPQATLESLERPILLLRSFSDDRRRVRANPGVRRSVVDAWSLRVGDHLEEILAWQVAEYGPLVAVGDPTTEQRRLGASRVHLEGGNWQAEVERMIRRAPLVVAVLGRSEGFLWEVDALVRAQALDRTVLVLPPISAREAGERLRLLDERLRNGGVLGFEPVRDPRRALCLGVRKGRVHAFVARKRDEAAYRAAVAMAASGLAAR